MDDKGQTAVEYLLLLAVMIAISISVFGVIKEQVLAGANNCTPEQKSLVCQFHRVFSHGQFRYFRLVR